MNCSEVILHYLKTAGIDRVFGYPGDPSVEFLEAARQLGVPFTLASREGTAGLMAEAYGQITGRPGVCLSTLGPGASNLVNAVANAYLDRVPMIALSGQIDTIREATFTHQVLNHALLFSPISKWTATIGAGNVGAVMRKALRTAVAERPGPVHLSTPADVVGAVAADASIAVPPMLASIGDMQVFRSAGTKDPVTSIREAKRPIILAGMSAQRCFAGEEIVRLAENLGCPVVVSPMAKGTIPETDPHFAGVLDMACNKLIWDFLAQSDLLINVGFDAVELIKPWVLRVPVIHIDSIPNTDQIYSAGSELVGSIKQILGYLAGAVATAGDRWTLAELAEWRRHLRAEYLSGRVAGKLNPTDVVEVVRAAAGDDAVVSTDVGSHKLLVGQGWTTTRPKGVLMTNGLSSMGYSLPASMVSNMMQPEREAICFTGDGGLAMVQGELRTASAAKLGLTVVVFCDNSLNRIELKQMARQYPAHGTLIEPTDMVKLAESMECDGIYAASEAELESALAQRSPKGTRPLVIAAKIDPTQYAAQF